MMFLAANFGWTLSEMNLVLNGMVGTAANAKTIFYLKMLVFTHSRMTPGEQIRSNRARYIPS